MNWSEDRGSFILRLATGEQVMASILAFAAERGIEGAEVRAIGAVDQASVGYFLREEKRYDVKEFDGNMEVVSLLGNLARTDAGMFVHAHIALGRSDFSLVGGHLVEATVSVTMEVFLRPVRAGLERDLDPRFNLKLLKLG